MSLVKKLMIKTLNLKAAILLKYKFFLAKGFTPICLEEVFMIKKVKNTVPWRYVINDLNREEIVETFYGKE